MGRSLVNINDIPIDTFLKYFNENVIHGKNEPKVQNLEHKQYEFTYGGKSCIIPIKTPAYKELSYFLGVELNNSIKIGAESTDIKCQLLDGKKQVYTAPLDKETIIFTFDSYCIRNATGYDKVDVVINTDGITFNSEGKASFVSKLYELDNGVYTVVNDITKFKPGEIFYETPDDTKKCTVKDETGILQGFKAFKLETESGIKTLVINNIAKTQVHNHNGDPIYIDSFGFETTNSYAKSPFLDHQRMLRTRLNSLLDYNDEYCYRFAPNTICAIQHGNDIEFAMYQEERKEVTYSKYTGGGNVSTTTIEYPTNSTEVTKFPITIAKLSDFKEISGYTVPIDVERGNVIFTQDIVASGDIVKLKELKRYTKFPGVDKEIVLKWDNTISTYLSIGANKSSHLGNVSPVDTIIYDYNGEVPYLVYKIDLGDNKNIPDYFKNKTARFKIGPAFVNGVFSTVGSKVFLNMGTNQYELLTRHDFQNTVIINAVDASENVVFIKIKLEKVKEEITSEKFVKIGASTNDVVSCAPENSLTAGSANPGESTFISISNKAGQGYNVLTKVETADGTIGIVADRVPYSITSAPVSGGSGPSVTVNKFSKDLKVTTYGLRNAVDPVETAAEILSDSECSGSLVRFMPLLFEDIEAIAKTKELKKDGFTATEYIISLNPDHNEDVYLKQTKIAYTTGYMSISADSKPESGDLSTFEKIKEYFKSFPSNENRFIVNTYIALRGDIVQDNVINNRKNDVFREMLENTIRDNRLTSINLRRVALESNAVDKMSVYSSAYTTLVEDDTAATEIESKKVDHNLLDIDDVHTNVILLTKKKEKADSTYGFITSTVGGDITDNRSGTEKLVDYSFNPTRYQYQKYQENLNSVSNTIKQYNASPDKVNYLNNDTLLKSEIYKDFARTGTTIEQVEDGVDITTLRDYIIQYAVNIALASADPISNRTDIIVAWDYVKEFNKNIWPLISDANYYVSVEEAPVNLTHKTNLYSSDYVKDNLNTILTTIYEIGDDDTWQIL